MEPYAVVRASTGNRDELAACARTGADGGRTGHGTWGAGETQEGPTVNPFLPDLKLTAPRRSARGLPRGLGAVPAEGRNPSRTETPLLP